MTREICQSARVVSAKAEPPCLTCTKQPECLVHFAQRKLFEAPTPGVLKKHLISRCDKWEDLTSFAVADIRRSLAGSSVKNLCRTCPDDHRGHCETDHNLGELKRVAATNGFDIETMVFTCHTADPSDKLYQIGEPRSRR